MSPLVITLIVIFSILAFLLITYFLLSFALAHYLTHPKRFKKEFTHQVDIDKGLIPLDMSYMKREPIEIRMEDGSYIHGDYSKNENEIGIMIIAHGYTWNREGSLKYAQFFYKHGFSILIYDERGHGENKTKFTTMGYKEGRDIVNIIEYCREKYGKDIPIGLHGESMGGASVLEAMKYHPDINFVIDDCGYSSLRKLLLHKMKQAHIPSIFIHGSNIMLKWLYKFSMEDVVPKDCVKDSDIPLLIIHGANDDFVPPDEGKEIFEARKDGSEFHLVPGADHAQSYQVNPQAYEEICMSFINNVLRRENL